MKRSSVKPYEGGDPYIFVSYCHKDRKYIFPIIEQMASDGYRVWYDEGIDPGEDWPEIIAGHLNGCSSCVSVISENSLKSHNCRREINFALLKKKPFISVFLEKVELSLGMEMQLSATQAIFKYSLNSDTEFFSKLYDAKCLANCMGAPNPGIAISRPEDYDDISDTPEESVMTRDPFTDEWFTTGGLKMPKAWIEIVNTGELIPLNRQETILGRSESLADYSISTNSTISRIHAKVVYHTGKYHIIDNHSTNKTYLNDGILDPDEEYELHDGDSVRLAKEELIFHLKQD